MTWDELKKEAKKMGYRVERTEFDDRENVEYLENPNKDFIFYQNGTIQIEADYDYWEGQRIEHPTKCLP